MPVVLVSTAKEPLPLPDARDQKGDRGSDIHEVVGIQQGVEVALVSLGLLASEIHGHGECGASRFDASPDGEVGDWFLFAVYGVWCSHKRTVDENLGVPVGQVQQILLAAVGQTKQGGLDAIHEERQLGPPVLEGLAKPQGTFKPLSLGCFVEGVDLTLDLLDDLPQPGISSADTRMGAFDL
jgi:hypothetical protein